MRALKVAIALVLVVAASMPATTLAGSTAKPFRWIRAGVVFQTHASVRERSVLGAGRATVGVDFRWHVQVRYWQQPIKVEKIRVALWKVRAGQPDQRIAVKTWGPNRPGGTWMKHRRYGYGAGRLFEDICGDPLGTEYYTTALFRQDGKRALYLSSRAIRVATDPDKPCLNS